MKSHALTLLSSLLFISQLPAVATGNAIQTAIFDVVVKDGKVDHIAIRVSATGEEYLINRFVDDDKEALQEAQAFRHGYASPGCAVTGANQECRSTCAWAENARPFTRVWRRTVGGRWQVLWPVGSERTDGRAFKFYAGASSKSSNDGDCISPDGRFVSLYGYSEPYQSGPGKFPGIYALAKRLPAVPFKGASSHKSYGEDRYFDFAGWKSGLPHTLLFNWGGDDGNGSPITDEAVPNSEAKSASPKTAR